MSRPYSPNAVKLFPMLMALGAWLGGDVVSFAEPRALPPEQPSPLPPPLRVFAPADHVSAVVQTADGPLWVATELGLFAFDGRSFDLQGGAHEPRGLIASLHKQPDGALYAGGSQGLWRRDVVTARFAPLSQVNQAVHALTGAGDGVIWVGGEDTLFRCKDDSCTAATRLAPLQGPIVAVHRDSKTGDVLFGTATGLFAWDQTSVKQLWQGDVVQALGTDKQGTMFAATETHGLLTPDAEGTWRPLPRDAWHFDPTVLGFHLDGEGALWIGTGNGLVVLRDGRFELAIPGAALPGVRVRSIAGDSEGNLWLGFDANGLVQVRRKVPFKAFSSAAGELPLTVAAAGDGGVWMVAEGTALSLWRDHRITTIRPNPEWGVVDLRALQVASNGDVWVAGFVAGGLYRVPASHRDSAVMELMREPLSLAHTPRISALHAGKDGALYLGLNNGDILVRRQDQTTTLSASPAGCPAIVSRLMLGADGHLWSATDGAGVCRIDVARKSFTRVGTAHEQTLGIISLAQLSDGNVWIGSRQHGVARVNGTTLDWVGYDQGLKAEIIGAMVEDRGHNVWMTSRAGIFRVPLEQLRTVADRKSSGLTPLHYTSADGLPSSDCISGWAEPAILDSQGRLWILTLLGPVMFEHPHDLPTPQMFGPRIGKITMNGRTVQAQGEGHVKFPTDQGNLHIEFGAVALSESRRLHYRYKLEGLDADWVQSADRQMAIYTNLRPGRYTFHVTAGLSGYAGVASTQSLQILLIPPFHRTGLFYALCAFTLVLMATLAARARAVALRRRKLLLTEERHRIARDIHDSLEQTFVAMRFQVEAAARSLPRPEVASGALERAESLMKRAMAETRAAIWSLRSDRPGQTDLNTQLAIVAGEASQGSGVHVQVSETGSSFSLPPEVQRHVVQIVREAVTNALKHAQPQSVAVKVAFSPHDLAIEVVDNGQGFGADPEVSPQGHYGLTGMHERAKQIGGRIKIQSVKGNGTTVKLEVPRPS